MDGHPSPTATATDADRAEWAGSDALGRGATARGRLVELGVESGTTDDSDALKTAGDDEADGRSLRRSRNRDAVITSLLELIREGSLDPNVADIAERAGVSHRSVFRYFDDINDLVRLAIDHEVREAMPLAIISDVGVGTLERRIDAYVDSRLRLYAKTYAVGRVARIKAPKIPALDEGLRLLGDVTRKQLAKHFAAECDQSPTDREFLLDTVMVLTSFEAYDYQRRMLQHGVERIRQVWHGALAAQLGAVGAASTETSPPTHEEPLH